MTDKLSDILYKLKSLRERLVKLNKSKRTPEALNKGLNEASQHYAEYLKCSDTIDEQIDSEEIKGSDIIQIKEICIRINTTYTQIQEFCSKILSENTKMAEKFDLKTAVALLPIIDNSEKSVKQLISAIDMYSSMLQNDGKLTLINFVLKTRLSESAKLRLSSNYDSVSGLISDMKKHLLVQKSSTALQQRLSRATQNQKNIEDYGKEIENLFVDLTVSQAEGDTAKYEILKSINEKQAIKRFSDGLRNGHLSTIISARNYTTLKDAIRAAKDEEMSSGSTFGQVMQYEQGKRQGYQHFQRGQRRGYSRGRGGYFSNRGVPADQQSRGHPTTNLGRSQGHNPRYFNRGGRGRYNPNFSNRGHQVNHAEYQYQGTSGGHATEQSVQNEHMNNSTFFRGS